MAESRVPIPLTTSRAEQIFPALTEPQMRRLTSHGTSRSVRAGEVLVELGDGEIPIFVIQITRESLLALVQTDAELSEIVVMSGELEIVRPSFTQETP